MRALAYGLGSVLIGITLAERGYSDGAVGAILAALLVGNASPRCSSPATATGSAAAASYRVLLVLMACAGAAFALTGWLPALIAAGLTGTLSTDVVESGPFTSLEQAMLPHAASGPDPTRLFGTYNTVATLAGSFGALLALAVPPPTCCSPTRWPPSRGSPSRGPVGRQSSSVWSSRPRRTGRSSTPAGSWPAVGLFALDSLGGGFVPQTFIAYLFTRKYDASPETLAILFFAIGLLQAVSFQAAVRIAGRIGLLRTMVFTHLPSNVLLVGVAFAPTLPTAIALLLARFALAQMDVPTRQAYLVAVVEPSERTAAAAYTNAARTLTRPAAPLLAGAALRAGLGRRS